MSNYGDILKFNEVGIVNELPDFTVKLSKKETQPFEGNTKLILSHWEFSIKKGSLEKIVTYGTGFGLNLPKKFAFGEVAYEILPKSDGWVVNEI